MVEQASDSRSTQIVSQMAVVMLAGGKAMKGMFGLDEGVTIICLALLAGSYTIYGGLRSVAWTDFLQFVVMSAGLLAVTALVIECAGEQSSSAATRGNAAQAG